MKTKFFWILVVFLGIFFSCKTKQVAQTPQPQPPVQKVEDQKLVPWTQDIDDKITADAPIIFYNQYEIIVKGKKTIIIKRYQDGKLCFKDSSITYDYSIPKETKGKLKKVETAAGKPVTFLVEFMLEDENYQHAFVVDGGFFTLSTNPKVVKTKDGSELSIKLGLKGDGSGKCKILYVPTHDNSEATEGTVATGVPDVSGIKTIKK